MWRLGIVVACVVTLALPGTAFAAAGQQISVNGTGGVVVPDGATNSQQLGAYDQALTAAIGDAQAKAQLVAQQLSLTLGPVESFTEESEDDLGYCGVGFLPGVAENGVSGSADAPAAAGSSSGQLTPIPAKHKKRKAKKKAHKAQQESENTCQVEADVTVVYSVS